VTKVDLEQKQKNVSSMSFVRWRSIPGRIDKFDGGQVQKRPCS
jgi:hypothetical protein